MVMPTVEDAIVDRVGRNLVDSALKLSHAGSKNYLRMEKRAEDRWWR
jgi:hypothetical protein